MRFLGGLNTLIINVTTYIFHISETLTQKQQSVSVLQMKRSNIITIALSRLPPPRHLPPAIYSMDSSVLDREDVQVQQLHFTMVISVCTHIKRSLVSVGLPLDYISI